jgi:uncharacterized membrane protein YagU involved in acid resistance
MQSKIVAAVVGGLCAGLIFGILMTVMTAPTQDDGRVPVMQMVAKIVGSDSLVVGWIYHLFNSAIIGAIFGVLVAGQTLGYGSAAGYGTLHGFAWWILGGLILMPLFLGMPAFTPLSMAPMRPVAIGSLIGHLMYGFILGVCYRALIARPIRQAAPQV